MAARYFLSDQSCPPETRPGFGRCRCRPQHAPVPKMHDHASPAPKVPHPTATDAIVDAPAVEKQRAALRALGDDEPFGVFVADRLNAFRFDVQQVGLLLGRFRLLKHAEAQKGEDAQHVEQVALHVRRLGLGERRRQRPLGIVDLALLGGSGQLQQAGFQMLDLGLVQAIVLGDEKDSPGPEVLFP